MSELLGSKKDKKKKKKKKSKRDKSSRTKEELLDKLNIDAIKATTHLHKRSASSFVKDNHNSDLEGSDNDKGADGFLDLQIDKKIKSDGLGNPEVIIFDEKLNEKLEAVDVGTGGDLNAEIGRDKLKGDVSNSGDKPAEANPNLLKVERGGKGGKGIDGSASEGEEGEIKNPVQYLKLNKSDRRRDKGSRRYRKRSSSRSRSSSESDSGSYERRRRKRRR